MSNIPDDLKYASTHEWISVNEDGLVTVGISDHAQEALGDIVFVELPEAGASVNSKEEVAVVESVKAASDVYAPISGEVIAINEALEDDPEIINSDPYGEGWFFRMKPDNIADYEALMTADEYESDL